ncbi:hypothetical protein [Streptomyces sp. NPDC048272]|uniref:hypothetical protein n=1 Tax=Streptomyces sp. NPDC048272 TaxID=3154616 RepID=UPI0034483097
MTVESPAGGPYLPGPDCIRTRTDAPVGYWRCRRSGRAGHRVGTQGRRIEAEVFHQLLPQELIDRRLAGAAVEATEQRGEQPIEQMP